MKGSLHDPTPPAIPENMVMVPEDQLKALIAQNQQLKSDIGQLVGVLQGFSTLFSGKTSLAGLIPVITKLLNDKSKLEAMSGIVPIIDKYTPKP